ncbi:MAG: TrmH family RNA methyltransferase [Anaerolineaceae bacterium]
METQTSQYIVQCLKPVCRFRYPLSEHPGQTVCPKCGSPVQISTFSHANPALLSGDQPVGQMAVLLDNIRSAYNVGAILRTADAVKASRLYCCGTTPTPDHPKVRKTALGAEFAASWSLEWNALDTVENCRRAGLKIVSLELSPAAVSVFDLQPEQVHFPLLLVLGSEVTGVDREILAVSDLVLQIPMLGAKGSINVSTAFGVAAYFLRYLENQKAGLA